MEQSKSFERLRMSVKDGVFKDRDTKAFWNAKKYKPENDLKKGNTVEKIMTYTAWNVRDPKEDKATGAHKSREEETRIVGKIPSKICRNTPGGKLEGNVREEQ